MARRAIIGRGCHPQRPMGKEKNSPVPAWQRARTSVSRWLDFFSKKKKETPAEPPEVVQIEETVEEETRPVFASPPLEKPPMQKKTKKKQQRSTPGRDKKGFRVLTAEHDLYRLFGVEKKSESKDFARMFNELQADRRQQRLLQEKKQSVDKPKPLTVGERIKDYPAPQAELDLHGYKAPEAEKRTLNFIRDARSRRIRTVRLIVGKGLHSQGKAVLPEVIEKIILQLKRNKWVLGFNWEKKDKRKSGALIVYLTPGP
jgi:DNA-nicking Smr family endonuclease